TRDYQNTFLGASSKAFENRLGYALACALHQGETRHAVLLDRQAIHLAHLRGGYDKHDRKKFQPFKTFNRFTPSFILPRVTGGRKGWGVLSVLTRFSSRFGEQLLHLAHGFFDPGDARGSDNIVADFELNDLRNAGD